MDTYTGRVCHNCGMSRRYKQDDNCVQCEDTDAKLVALSDHKELYHGKECSGCTGSVRYTSNGRCYECTSDPAIPRKRTKQGKATKNKSRNPAFMHYDFSIYGVDTD